MPPQTVSMLWVCMHSHPGLMPPSVQVLGLRTYLLTSKMVRKPRTLAGRCRAASEHVGGLRSDFCCDIGSPSAHAMWLTHHIPPASPLAAPPSAKSTKRSLLPPHSFSKCHGCKKEKVTTLPDSNTLLQNSKTSTQQPGLICRPGFQPAPPEDLQVSPRPRPTGSGIEETPSQEGTIVRLSR